MTLPQLRRFPLPGTASLFIYDRITIKGVELPLAGPIESGIELEIEKRKAPGSDYSSYVSHGIDAVPIRIRLMLFRDIMSGKDWYEDYEKIREALISRRLDKRNAIQVWHPFLDLEGINEIVFVKRSLPTQMRGQIFQVTLEGYNPAQLRVGSGSGRSTVKVSQDPELINPTPGKSREVKNDKQNAQSPTARQNKGNYKGPAANNAGKKNAPAQRT